MRKWTAKDSERQKRKYREDPEFRRRRIEAASQYQREHATQRRVRRYGLSVDALRELEAQHSGCAICGGDGGQRGLFIDHHHASGRVRGLLCERCNFGLGLFDDAPSKLRVALAYLESHSTILGHKDEA